jgi:hypothetical protein
MSIDPIERIRAVERVRVSAQQVEQPVHRLVEVHRAGSGFAEPADAGVRIDADDDGAAAGESRRLVGGVAGFDGLEEEGESVEAGDPHGASRCYYARPLVGYRFGGEHEAHRALERRRARQPADGEGVAYGVVNVLSERTIVVLEITSWDRLRPQVLAYNHDVSRITEHREELNGDQIVTGSIYVGGCRRDEMIVTRLLEWPYIATNQVRKGVRR